MDANKKPIRNSLRQTFLQLRVTIAAAYTLAPVAVLLLLSFAIAAIYLTTFWAPLMTAAAVILVLLVSLCVYSVRENFGEGLLSLVAGLTSIFAFEWTVDRYVAFSLAWTIFVVSAMLISSVKVAAKTESIYRQAGLQLVGPFGPLETMEKRLKELGASQAIHYLGPVERAELIRFLAYRKLPIDSFLPCLTAVDSLSVITECDNKTVMMFVSDLYQALASHEPVDATWFTDALLASITDSRVPPQEYFRAFENSRSMVLSNAFAPMEYLESLKECLSVGTSPDRAHDYLLSRKRVDG